MRKEYLKKLLSLGYLVGNRNESYKEANYILYEKCNAIINEGYELCSIDTVTFLSEELGINTSSPLFKNFPSSVITTENYKLFIDQMSHYIFKTRSITDSIEVDRHSVVLRDSEVTKKIYKCVDVTDGILILINTADNLLKSSRPISVDDIKFIASIINDKIYTPSKKINSKKNTIDLLIETKNTDLFTKYMKVSDVLTLANALEQKKVIKVKNNKLHLGKPELKLIESVLDKCLDKWKYASDPSTVSGDIDICVSKRKIFIGLLNRMHVGGKNTPENIKVFNSLIRDKDLKSTMSKVEEHIKNGDVVNATKILTNSSPVAALRHIVYLLSRTTNKSEAIEVIDTVFNNNPFNNIILFQILKSSDTIGKRMKRTFTFTSNHMLKNHTETDDEMNNRKSVIPEWKTKLLLNKIESELNKNNNGKLGKVYVDGDLTKIALPLKIDSSSSSGINYLPPGSSIKIPDGKIIRAFVAWTLVPDIDISSILIDENDNRRVVNWSSSPHLFKDMGLVFSGDETDGYKGGVEYFDIDPEKLSSYVRYVVICSNIYSSGYRYNTCDAYGGYLIRDSYEPGTMTAYEEIYDIKTVGQRFKITGDTTENKVFVIDLKTRELIWLNITENSSRQVVQADKNIIDKIINEREKLTYQTLVDYCASEIVDNIYDADYIVTSDNNFSCDANATILRPCDVDKIISLLDNSTV